MKNQINEKLRKAYPLLMNQDNHGRTPFNLFGIEIGPGWLPVVFEFLGFCEDLQQKTGKAVSISQIKEKFGTLRIYCNLPCESMEEHIIETLFELQSSQICDICGEPGRLGNETGYWCTRCENHRNLKDREAIRKAELLCLERLLDYERKGLSCHGIAFAESCESDKGEGLASLDVYFPSSHIPNLRNGLSEYLTTQSYKDKPVNELKERVEQLSRDGLKIGSWSDGSETGSKAIGSE